MARNSVGTMSPPGSYPPVDGALISLDDYKALVQDLITEMTDSLSRSGKGDMQAPLHNVDGTLAAPGMAFASEVGSGLYRAAAGDLRIALLGALAAKLTAAGLEVTGTIKSTGTIQSAGLADDTSHGNRGGGLLHTLASGSTSGFMWATDKAKLDAATAAPSASQLVQRDSSGRAQFATPSAAADAATKGYVDGFTVLPIAGVNSGGGLAWSRGFSGATRSAVGTYNLTFQVAQPDTNYVPSITMEGTTADYAVVSAKSTTGFTVLVERGGADCAFSVSLSR